MYICLQMSQIHMLYGVSFISLYDPNSELPVHFLKICVAPPVKRIKTLTTVAMFLAIIKVLRLYGVPTVRVEHELGFIFK